MIALTTPSIEERKIEYEFVIREQSLLSPDSST
jgi:hypothetical protein